MNDIEKTAYCAFECPKQDRYNGWCNYYYKDLCEIDVLKCEVIKKLEKAK